MNTLVVDDSVLLREGIARILDDAGFRVVGQRGDADGLVELVDETDARLVIIDIRIPPTHTTEGLEAAIALRATRPGVAVVLVSQHVETRYALELLADGAPGVGYLLKDRIAAITSSSTPCAASRAAAPSSTPTSSPAWWRGSVATTRSTRSANESARCSP